MIYILILGLWTIGKSEPAKPAVDRSALIAELKAGGIKQLQKNDKTILSFAAAEDKHLVNAVEWLREISPRETVKKKIQPFRIPIFRNQACPT